MRLRIVVDANPIISALVGGTARDIFFRTNLKFATTEFTVKEIEKFIPYISEKAEVSEEEIEKALSLLPIKIYRRKFYSKTIEKSRKIIGKVDEKDVDILALALKLNVPLWSNDRHFDKVKEAPILKTKDLF